MALEDFFTLTEMKDGLGTIDRVELLVSMIQKEKDSAMKNVGETARQWSTVANTLAATEKMVILKHFIQLGGLDFFHQWLQEAQQYSDDTSESSVEESTSELLRALEKFPIDNNAPNFSGIMTSLEDLMVHKSPRVQEKAKALYDLLNHGMEKKRDSLDVGKDCGCQVELKPLNARATEGSSSLKHPAVKFSHAEVDSNEVRNTNVLPGSELQHSRSSACTLLECVGVGEAPFSKKQNCDTTSNQVDENIHQSEAQGLSIISTPSHSCPGNVEESFMHPGGGTSSVGTCSSPGTVKNNGKTNLLNVMVEKDFRIEQAVTESTEQNPDNFVEEEIFNVSSSVGPYRVSSADTHAQQSGVEPDILNDVDGKDRVFCVRKTLSTGIDSNMSTAVSSPSDMATNFGLPKQSNSEVNCKTIDQHEGRCSNVSRDLSVSGCISSKSDNEKSHLPGEMNDVKEIACELIIKERDCDDSATTSDVSKPKVVRASDEIVKSGLDMELDLVEDNAPAIARRVCKEVEREVVDYKEELCRSPSMKNSEAKVLKSDSPDSVNGVHDEPMVERPKVKSADENLCGSVISFKGEDHSIDAKDMVKTEDCAFNHEVSQAMEHDQESAYVKNAHGFDLNEESSSQEMDQPAVMYSSTLTGTSMSGCSKSAAIITPSSHFEEKPGCSASAAASNLRIPDAEIASSVEGSSSGKQKREFLDIDLNVADGTTELMLVKIPVTSGFLSGESSVEVDSNKRLKLDLNDTVDDGARSSSSTSSSLKQSGIIRLDLNDNPTLYEPDGQISDHDASSSRGKNNSGGLQVDGPCISILGTRVPIFPQTRALFPNGPFPVSSMSANYEQSGSGVGVGTQYAMAYVPPSPGAGYNGLHMEPSMSLSSVMYGPGPVLYTVDPRESPVGQQIMGSSPPPPSYPRTLFPMSTTSAQLGFSWGGPSQPNLNLSSGLFIEEVEREQGPSRQVNIPGQDSMTDEQRGSSQPMTSAVLRMKMREPDNECDPYLGLYRRQPPWL